PREQGQGAKTQKALKESLLENLHSNIEGLRGRIEESQKELHGLLERYGVAHDSDFKDLSTRRDAYKNRTTEEASLEKELATLCPQLDATMTLIQKETETLADHTADIKARKQEIEQLTAQRCEIVPSSDALRQTLVEGQKEQTVLQQSIGALREKVQRNEEMKDKRASHAQAIEAQQQELLRWRDLHLLIGSADGKKFRDFAQGLTFEMLIHRANSQLQKMSDRYLLVRDRMHSLELNVIDNYQGGEERSTKNLSGGESFIVSLALALGLSQMSSQKVRVESLFLDEGFGTLDEEALDTALETLSGLQEEGKSIGVISHVAALKERISTQIRILADAAGRSQICGPGCARLD
ncbi:MAG: hypothetical protein KDK78_02575, partial [Chlamydiia bacterium]|nr:hypothetical protein [Chlamydiia bacterium]